MALTDEQKNAMDAEFAKVGETAAKIGNGILGWLVSLAGKIGDTLGPMLERILTNALSAYIQSAADRILKKNGIDPASVNK